MDFGRILRSLEEFLYELMTWLVFYPRTLFRILSRPVAVARYAQLQLRQPPELQYTEVMAPILMLIVSVLLPYGVSLGYAAPPPAAALPKLFQTLDASPEGLLLFRCASFSVYALAGALLMLSRRGIRIDRDVLREPFHIWAFLTSPFALFVSFSLLLPGLVPSTSGKTAGIIVASLAFLWYVWAQASVLRDQLDIGRGRAYAYAFLLGGGVSLGLVALTVAATLLDPGYHVPE